MDGHPRVVVVVPIEALVLSCSLQQSGAFLELFAYTGAQARGPEVRGPLMKASMVMLLSGRPASSVGGADCRARVFMLVPLGPFQVLRKGAHKGQIL